MTATVPSNTANAAAKAGSPPLAPRQPARRRRPVPPRVPAAADDQAVAEEEVAMGAARVSPMLRIIHIALALGALLAIGQPVLAAAPTAAKAPAQATFPTADAAVAALVDALQKNDAAETALVFGPGSEALLSSGDPTRDQQERSRFLESYAAKHRLLEDGPGRMVLRIGANDWPMPIPIVQDGGQWRFDTRTGAQEIVNRRIGRNELDAIRFAFAYVDAQKAYFALFAQATGTGAYAQRLVSTDGNYDGLYWPSVDGIPDSPLESLVENAVDEGYPGELVSGKQVPYEGYYFRILTAQGPDAVGGRQSYLKDGKLVGGFALIAWPAIYGASGVMSFIVNRDGVVYQRDLGPTTAARANDIKAFNPSIEWARVDVAAGP